MKKTAETAEMAETMFGPQLYQERARSALPLLIQFAKARRVVTYGKLASFLNMPNARNLNYVLGSVGRTLSELAQKRDFGIPRIQTLVVSKSNGQPGKGIDGFFDRQGLQDRAQLMREEQQSVFNFEGWDEVLEDLGLPPSSRQFGDQIKRARECNGGSGREGDEHRALKEWICANPEFLGLKNPDLAETERKLASGDSLDVSFQASNKWVAVEVKASNANEADLTRGIFQIVKYKAVMNAELKVSNVQSEVCAVLVVENVVPLDLQELAGSLSVQFIEVTKVEGDFEAVRL
ncbi:hypothetical protein GFK91_09440 [Roseibium aggregatum]|uniref:hypothetical protein n=1 Tax=Roseibium aggregatum TaxID=187304 RepID=UPI001E608721|nr:hypothetical protein [Roseibium aggregatum]UES55810.1 hypothetical protein GFK91_09440 [Roseibium aggregatum]